MIRIAIIWTVIFVLWLLVVLSAPEMAYKRNGKFADAVNYFTFTDNSVNIVGRGERFSNEGTFSYDSFDRVYETSQCIFVYINIATAYVYYKKSIVAEDNDTLKDKLLSAVEKKKYHICKY